MQQARVGTKIPNDLSYDLEDFLGRLLLRVSSELGEVKAVEWSGLYQTGTPDGHRHNHAPYTRASFTILFTSPPYVLRQQAWISSATGRWKDGDHNARSRNKLYQVLTNNI